VNYYFHWIILTLIMTRTIGRRRRVMLLLLLLLLLMVVWLWLWKLDRTVFMRRHADDIILAVVPVLFCSVSDHDDTVDSSSLL
jgi:Trk-type K+ transport system membrane component